MQANVSIKRAILIYCVVSLFLVFEMGVQVSSGVMAAPLMRDLNIGAFSLGIMSGFYFYTYAGMQIPSGILFDRFSPKLIILISIFVCSLGTFTFAGIHDIYFGSLARLLMGFGSAFAFVSVLIVASDIFPSKYFVVIAGVTQMLAALGAMLGQLPLNILIEHVGWRMAMVILGVLGLLLMLVVWKFVNYDKPKASTEHKASASSIGKDLKAIVSSSKTWLIAGYACLLWAPMSGFASLWGVPFLMHASFFDKSSAALLSSLMWLGLAVASPLLGLLSVRLVNKSSLLCASALIGAVAFAVVLEFHSSKAILGLLLFVAGAACTGQALSFALVKESHPKERQATAIAFNNMAVVLSGAIFQPLIGKLITSLTMLHLADRYKVGCFIIFLAYLVAGLLALILMRRESRENRKRNLVNLASQS